MDGGQLMRGSCSLSPTGEHCSHGHEGAWFGITPPPSHCCWCGQGPQQHGPFQHGRGECGTTTTRPTTYGAEHGVSNIAFIKGEYQ